MLRSFIRKILLMVASNFLVLFVIIILNSKLELGLSKLEMDVFIFPFLIIINFFIAIPSLRKNFFKQFIKIKELHLIIALPVLIAIIKLFLVYLYMYLPLFFNKDSVSIGSDQYVASDNLSSLGQFLMVGILGPFTEEVIFRYFLLFLLPYALFLFLYNKRAIIKRFVSKSLFLFGKNIIHTHSKVIITIWVIFVSTLFSLGHGPDLRSFPIYFIGGAIYGFLFVKYGFLSAWVAHGSFNALSPIMNAVVWMFLNFYY